MSYDVPAWAGKPPLGLHLDVLKDQKLVQKLMIDEKKCYLFGRNSQMNDFCIDHASCSRVHAAFVYHKQLNIAYLVDLGSTHGTFIGSLCLEAHKPTQLQINSTFHFGASTRYYTLRERPSVCSRNTNIMEDIPMNESSDGALLGLPESQTELDNLTEYNTAHNRRISMLGITEDNHFKKITKGKRKRRGVSFNEEENIINPEDVDPSIGRFRNLIHTTVIPTKKIKFENAIGISITPSPSLTDTKHLHPSSLIPHLYQGLPPLSENFKLISGSGTSFLDGDITPVSNLVSKLGLLLPNPAPDVLPTNEIKNVNNISFKSSEQLEDVPKKKKYAKEAWPGRKPLLSGF